MSQQTDKTETQAGASGSPQPDELSRLQDELKGARADLEAKDRRIDELARALSALRNDQVEFRGRLEREKERVLDAERGKVALPLLQIGDEIERALGAAGEDKGPLAQGVRLIHENLGRTLSALGLERLSLVGKPYDPNLAEAIDLVPVADAASDGQVVAEVTAGYKLGSRVLRAAKVRVARHVPAPSSEAAPESAPH